MNRQKHIILKTTQGKPSHVIVPYDDYVELLDRAQYPKTLHSKTPKTKTAHSNTSESGAIPLEVAELLKNNWSLIRAWREYLGVTQIEMAQRLNIRQPTFAHMEAPGTKPRKATLKRIAKALDISLEQLSPK
ncbi:helix-turn-helix domain-containing protein [Brackiella oedipodis]|uniref:helix-turn-helix domain-containing protein n=1 Tax=Brackiella oedipodis TaxID=124225 RepID=UPI00048D7AD4|nr:helix-turn-helix transcriptional regulator [Brackiella oedipodis]